ncbi:hypothetical protein [Agromyces allii]|uniref:Uncharacterized protein n=1 Tax=Agromyces allii TaxID=393607 RepID=A0ABP5C4Y9_9MICO|nr:hypothetical protein [Agromyces allii]
MRIDLERIDIHAADHYGRKRSIEVDERMLLSELVETVCGPFLPELDWATWTIRAERSGTYGDIARTGGRDEPPHLLIQDASLLEVTNGAPELRIFCLLTEG